jgi:hypothetical protein
MWSVDCGIQKQLFDGKANVKLALSDVFFSMKWRGESDFAGQHLVASGNFESRQVKLNFSYRFGNTQVKAARQRKSGQEDENKSLGSQGGGLNGE